MLHTEPIDQTIDPIQVYNPLITPDNLPLEYKDGEIRYLIGGKRVTQKISIQNWKRPHLPEIQSKRIDSAHTAIASGLSDIANQSQVHDLLGQNRKVVMAIIRTLMVIPGEKWNSLCQEFSWITNIKTNPPEKLFPGDAFLNHKF